MISYLSIHPVSYQSILVTILSSNNLIFKGTLIHVETDEAIAQMTPQIEEDEAVEETESKASVAASAAGSQTASAAGSSASVPPSEEKPKKKEKLIRNQFNFQDRGTQSGNPYGFIVC